MLSKVDFFISKMHESCKVSERDWYITIFNPDGTLLEFCGRDYLVIKAVCGHAEIKIPPGKYFACAVWSYWQGPDGQFWGNHFTHKSIFQCDSGRHQCVWLYNPSQHECGIIYDTATTHMAGNLDQAAADLEAAGVDPADPRFGQINEMRAAIDTNLPAVRALRGAADQFFDVFVGNALEPGTDINREVLLGGTAQDPAMIEKMVEANSEKIPAPFEVKAEIRGTLVE